MTNKKSLCRALAAALSAFAGSTQAALNVETDGIGSILIVPYFSTQNGNSTLINVFNTDETNGKAVKIRFRGGRDADSIYDFQLFLSPGDVWTANLSQNVLGLTTLTTGDNSCTLPTRVVLNATPFSTARTMPGDGANGTNGTREGYVDIITMADLPPGTTRTSPVYATTKHAANGTPTCAAAILDNIEQNGSYNAADETVRVAGSASGTLLAAPTTGLFANWTIINVPQTTVFSGSAVAIDATTPTRIVYSRQSSDAVDAEVSSTAFPNLASTFDAVLLTTGFPTVESDFPDLSTPYELATATAGAQVYQLSTAIAHDMLANEFILDSTIGGKTDFLVNMPTRRYLVSGRGESLTGVTAAATGTYASSARFRTTLANSGLGGAFIAPNSFAYADNDSVSKAGALAWFRGVTTYAGDGRSSCVRLGAYRPAGREEQTEVTSNVCAGGCPPSPFPYALCGAVNAVSLNGLVSNTAAIGANLAVLGMSVPYVNGWVSIRLDVPEHSGGLPVVGYASVKATSPAVAKGISGTFSGTWAHHWLRRSPD